MKKYIEEKLELQINTNELLENLEIILDDSEWSVGLIDYEYNRKWRSIFIYEGETIFTAVEKLAKSYFADFYFNENTKKVDFVFNQSLKDSHPTPPEVLKLQEKLKEK